MTLALAVLVSMIATTSAASAHEGREVGDYHFVVGFLNEPAIVEELNGLILRVSRGEEESAEPLEGLAETLRAEVAFGAETRLLELRPAFGEPGSYRAEFIPTAEGAYTFRIFGSVEGMEVDETFTSGPDTFSEVEGRAEMSFPAAVPAVSQVSDTAADAEDAAGTAQLIAILGLLAGLLGLATGVVAISLARRSPATASTGAALHEPGD